MDQLIEFAKTNAHMAHWILFGATRLAGINIPISIDLLMIIGATLAATLVPEHFYHLYFSLFIGCTVSAWLAYGIGKLLGSKFLKLPLISQLIHSKRMDQVKIFYEKRGLLALAIGRFIPFGIRNCLYISSGMSKMPFAKFVFCDGLACALWSSLSFALYYKLGKNIDVVYSQVTRVNFALFLAFSVAVIGLIWYKKKKKIKEANV